MIIDPTTHNQIYDPTSPQGEWYAHRWGRRDYPEVELQNDDLTTLYCRPTEPLHLKCMYGDPADWTDIDKFLRAKNSFTVIMDTYGMLKDSTIRILKRQERQVNIYIDGWENTMGKVFLGQDFETVKSSIMELKDVVCNQKPALIVHYNLYQHNIEDAKRFCEFAEEEGVTIRVFPGKHCNGYYHSIIDENSNWLYDVFPVDFEDLQEHERLIEISENQATFYPFPEPDPSLACMPKTLAAYNTLRTFMKDPEGESILDDALITNLFPDKKLKIELTRRMIGEDNRYLCPTGHILPNMQLGVTFMNMLCSDWSFKKSDIVTLKTSYSGYGIDEFEEYRLELLHYAQEIKKLDLDKLKVQLVR